MIARMNFFNFGFFLGSVIVICAVSIQCLEPKNSIQVFSGQTVGLPCKFNRLMEVCWWTREGQRVVTSDRYRFSDGEPFNTDICSIQINKADPVHDTGVWECHYRQQVEDEVKKWIEYHLSVQDQPPEYEQFLEAPTSKNEAGSPQGWFSCVIIVFSCSFSFYFTTT